MEHKQSCNPFPRQTTLKDLTYYVRDDRVIEEVDECIENITDCGRGDDLLIIGEGGSGKSSLLKYIEERCQAEGIFAIKWTLGFSVARTTPGQFFKALDRKIIHTV